MTLLLKLRVPQTHGCSRLSCVLTWCECAHPQRSGTTRPVLGADDPTARAPGKGFHLKFAFNEVITFPVTLYKARSSRHPQRRASTPHLWQSNCGNLLLSATHTGERVQRQL